MDAHSDVRTGLFRRGSASHLPATWKSLSPRRQPDITAEYNKEGELIGVEIVNASKAIFNMLVDDLQLKEAI